MLELIVKGPGGYCCASTSDLLVQRLGVVHSSADALGLDLGALRISALSMLWKEEDSS